MTIDEETKHGREDMDSWENYLSRKNEVQHSSKRRLKHHHHKKHVNAEAIEAEKEAQFWTQHEQDQKMADKLRKKELKHHNKKMHELWSHPGIDSQAVHGLMIDAGSTGSRLHVYEWEPRILYNEDDIQAAVSGGKLTFPGTESRWTDRLHPGLASFAELPDDQIVQAIADYLQPLMDFALTILHSKEDQFGSYPIFLRATAGMRIIDAKDRARVLQAVRTIFSNKTYCPFAFEDEHVRVLSGEEEAIYDWAGVNFLSGDLIQQSEGAGTVVNPKLTHGALDLGGGSTQIGFYETNEDIMSNLFKLQIGQAKHWNVYAHSFLYYGMNEAIKRFEARLSAGKTSEERLVEGVYNPCFPGGFSKQVRNDIHLSEHETETWKYNQDYPSGNGFYQAVLRNSNKTGNADLCLEMAKDLLHLEKNDWCKFAHKGDCSFAGIYQPKLPVQNENFGEFLAFSNYFHVWNFLQLPERATLYQLENATRHACSLNHEELLAFAANTSKLDDVESYCFRSAYVFQLLHNGFGFQMNETIRAVKVVNGHKVGWALGAMLYEINTLPWSYVNKVSEQIQEEKQKLDFAWNAFFMGLVVLAMFASLMLMFALRERRNKRFYDQYDIVKDVEM